MDRLPRCGICLLPVKKLFLHDCGDKLSSHYVERLKNELERLGVWLSDNISESELSGGVSVVDAAKLHY